MTTTALRDPHEVTVPILKPDASGEPGKSRVTFVVVPVEECAYLVDVIPSLWPGRRESVTADALAMARAERQLAGVTLIRDPWIKHVQALLPANHDDGHPFWVPEHAAWGHLVLRYRLHVHTRGYTTPEGNTP